MVTIRFIISCVYCLICFESVAALLSRGRLQEPSERLQELSKRFQESFTYVSRVPIDVLKYPKDNPQTIQRASKTIRGAHKEVQGDPAETKRHARASQRDTQTFQVPPLRGSKRVSTDVLMLSCSKTLRPTYPHHPMLARYRDLVL